jgi:uncharacterized protein
MKKRFISILLVAFLCVASAVPVFADSFPDTRLQERLVDDADILTDSEKSALIAKLNEISERQNLDVTILTTNSIGNEEPRVYAADFFEASGYGVGNNHDGIILMLSMEERDWAIATHGYGIEVFTDAGQDYITDQIVDYFSDGEYYEGFDKYADLCDEFITQANNDEPYDSGDLPSAKPTIFNYVMMIGGALLIGIVCALVGTGIMRSKLKTVRFQNSANDYIRQNSMKLTSQNDILLYTHVTRHKKEDNNSRGGGSSTFSSSSGSSFGGSSGKF